MKCKKCNAELLDSSAFCPYCGTKCEDPVIEIIDNMNYKKEMNQEKDDEATCWAKFANVGNTLGIITIATCWIPILGLYAFLPGVPGIVFSSLGKKSRKINVKEKAKSGFLKSLIGTILSFIIFIIWVVIIESAAY